MIAYDNVTWSNTASIGMALAGSSRALTVTAIGNGVLTATFNGVSMPRVGNFSFNSSDFYSFVLANPASGTHNIVISGSSSTPSLYAESFTGVDQTTPCNAYSFNTFSGSTNHISNTITTTVDNSWVAGFVLGANRTGTTNLFIRNTPPGVAQGDSNGVISPAGNFTQSANFSPNSLNPVIVQMALSPSTTLPTNGAFLMNFI